MAESVPRTGAAAARGAGGYSLRWRLIAAVTIAAVPVFLATGVYVYAYSRHEIARLLDAHLAQSASLIVAQVGHGLEEIDVDRTPELNDRARHVVFQVWEHGDELRLRSRRAPASRLATREAGFSDSEIDGHAWRVFSTWDDHHHYLIEVGERSDARTEIAGALALGAAAALGAALLVLATIAWLGIGRVVAPLRALGRAVAARRPEELEPLDVRGAPSEVRPLVDNLNALFARVARLVEGERRFTADAAHELRTPLAAVRAQAEVARDATDETVRRHALAQVIEATDRATRLTGQLLTLARLEPGVARPAFRRCDLAALARDVVAELAPTAIARGVALEVAEGGPVRVEGDAGLLAVLVRNLVDNAIRYGGAGGLVRIEAKVQDGRPLVAVSDRGPGLEPADIARLGERFYRVLGTGEVGSGLGLSIVRRIADLHSAELTLSSGSGGRGLRASVTFPAPDASP